MLNTSSPEHRQSLTHTTEVYSAVKGEGIWGGGQCVIQ